jgi:hypothetical protein
VGGGLQQACLADPRRALDVGERAGPGGGCVGDALELCQLGVTLQQRHPRHSHHRQSLSDCGVDL